jgi:hypothetical protein
MKRAQASLILFQQSRITSEETAEHLNSFCRFGFYPSRLRSLACNFAALSRIVHSIRQDYQRGEPQPAAREPQPILDFRTASGRLPQRYGIIFNYYGLPGSPLAVMSSI